MSFYVMLILRFRDLLIMSIETLIQVLGQPPSSRPNYHLPITYPFGNRLTTFAAVAGRFYFTA